MALIAHAATLESRIPFLHFFDGFRTSHEVAKIEQLSARRHARHDRRRPGARPSRARPVARSSRAPRHRRRIPTSTSRRAKPVNPFYLACPTIVQNAMDKFAAASSAASITCSITSARPMPSASSSSWAPAPRPRTRPSSLTAAGREGRPAQGPPLSGRSRSSTSWTRCPTTVKSIAVLDRTKEPGAIGEPLYLDVVTALTEGFTAGKAPMAASPRSSAAATASRPRNSRPRW